MADAFIADYYSASPKTQRLYQDNIEKALLRYFDARGINNLLDVTPPLLRDYLAHQQSTPYELKGHVRNLSAATLQLRYSTAKTFFGWCVDQDYLPANPMMKVKRPKLPQRLKTGYTKEEIGRLVEAASKGPNWIGVRDRAIILLLLGTGARASELLSMQFDCVQWTIPRPRPGERPQRARLLTLHGKGSKDRKVPIGSTAFGALRDYMAVRPESSHREIWLSQRGSVLTQGALNQLMVNLREYADVANVTPHRFRHSYATAWYREHKDIMALKHLLGHTKVETTQRYLASLGADYGLDGDYATPDSWLVA